MNIDNTPHSLHDSDTYSPFETIACVCDECGSRIFVDEEYYCFDTHNVCFGCIDDYTAYFKRIGMEYVPEYDD